MQCINDFKLKGYGTPIKFVKYNNMLTVEFQKNYEFERDGVFITFKGSSLVHLGTGMFVKSDTKFNIYKITY